MNRDEKEKSYLLRIDDGVLGDSIVTSSRGALAVLVALVDACDRLAFQGSIGEAENISILLDFRTHFVMNTK